jgi:hypothetical protein
MGEIFLAIVPVNPATGADQGKRGLQGEARPGKHQIGFSIVEAPSVPSPRGSVEKLLLSEFQARDPLEVADILGQEDAPVD